jgi:hypothetical protein
VAPLLVDVLRRRELGVDEQTLAWFEGVSARLAALRGPAFYHEEEYEERDAAEAAADAQRALELASELLERLRSA